MRLSIRGEVGDSEIDSKESCNEVWKEESEKE